MASSRDLSFKVSLKDEATPGLGRISSAARTEMRKVDSAFDDTASAGKRMASVLGGIADDLETELAGTERAVDKLAEALGPEFAPEGVNRIVGDLRNAGLTFDDIEKDAEELAAAIKRIEDVGAKAGTTTKRAFDDVDSSVRGVGAEADKTGGVVANAAGNMAQDMGAVAGVTGTAGLAMGQFAEYAAEGGISLKSFATTVGPLLLASVAVSKIAEAQAKGAAAAALHTSQVEDLVGSIRDGQTAAEGLADAFRDAGKVEISFGDFGAADITGVLQRVGLSVDQFTEIAAGGRDTVLEWRDAALEAGVAGDSIDVTLVAMAESARVMDDATRGAAVAEQVLGRSTRDTAAALERAKARTDDLVDSMREQRDITNEVNDAALSQLDLQLQLADANRDSEDSYRTYLEAIGEFGEGSREALDAERAFVDAQVRAAEVAGETASANEIAAGRISTAAGASRDAQVRALQDLLLKIDRNSPLRQAIEEHIWILASIPRNIGTDITISGNAAGPRYGARAAGGPVTRGMPYIVGENRPELFVPDTNGTILPSVPSGIGGGVTFTGPITVVANNPESLVDQLIVYARRNGGLPRALR